MYLSVLVDRKKVSWMFWVYYIEAGTDPGPNIAEDGITNGLFVQMTVINDPLTSPLQNFGDKGCRFHLNWENCCIGSER